MCIRDRMPSIHRLPHPMVDVDARLLRAAATHQSYRSQSHNTHVTASRASIHRGLWRTGTGNCCKWKKVPVWHLVPFPFLLSLYRSPPSSFPHFPFLSLTFVSIPCPGVSSPNSARRVGERRELPQRIWAEIGRQTISDAF